MDVMIPRRIKALSNIAETEEILVGGKSKNFHGLDGSL